MYCNETDWLLEYGKYSTWYRENYPWLREFPLKLEDLKTFYVLDMQQRNLTPLETMLNCYEFLFSYALENVPRLDDPTRFKGQTFWSRLVKDQWQDESVLWTAWKQTKKDIITVGSWIVPGLIILGIVYLIGRMS
jgi:hypothetical protein